MKDQPPFLDEQIEKRCITDSPNNTSMFLNSELFLLLNRLLIKTKESIMPSYLPIVEGEVMDSCLYLTYKCEMKGKRSCQGFELDSSYVMRHHLIILSCHQHGYPWPFLANPPYCSSLLAGPRGYISYPHRSAVYRFELVSLLLLGHVRESIGEHHLWARPRFSSSVLHVWSNLDSFRDGR